ncbi:hypothetical protein PR003_g28290 [Phytophthora rubi]|uniref:Uncharacterized protein n=2 Tax=Phytophthora rubi TaxID=129364 RepID=A0A6A4C058_9STRA|nr:hypothetical protein PR003_g28290 [Phytophthora rubi]
MPQEETPKRQAIEDWPMPKTTPESEKRHYPRPTHQRPQLQLARANQQKRDRDAWTGGSCDAAAPSVEDRGDKSRLRFDEDDADEVDAGGLERGTTGVDEASVDGSSGLDDPPPLCGDPTKTSGGWRPSSVQSISSVEMPADARTIVSTSNSCIAEWRRKTEFARRKLLFSSCRALMRAAADGRGRLGVYVDDAALERGGHLPGRLQGGFRFSQPLEEFQPFGLELVDSILRLVKFGRRLHTEDIRLHAEIHLNAQFVLRILRQSLEPIHPLTERHHFLGLGDRQTSRSHSSRGHLFESRGMFKAPVQHRIDPSGRCTSDADDQLGETRPLLRQPQPRPTPRELPTMPKARELATEGDWHAAERLEASDTGNHPVSRAMRTAEPQTVLGKDPGCSPEAQKARPRTPELRNPCRRPEKERLEERRRADEIW